ncbi:MAG TPA: hypothetical protein VMT61_02350 [Candidatus Binataceae bacterium]|nr:hypothetical protein [Candidatus Binataceae bacterium]
MKTLAHRFAINVLGRAITLLVLSGTVLAQQSLEIPIPANQGAAPSYHRPKPTAMATPPSARIETIPSVPQAPPLEAPHAPKPPAMQPSPEPVLPAVFRGCWEGRVDYLDSIQRLPGGAKIGPWTPKTYRLCYIRTGNGPFELTFTDAGVVQSRKITNAVGRMELLSSDGRTFATMRALLHFDEFRMQPGFGTFPVDELTQLECDIEPAGMQVWGQVYGQQSGQPWFKAYWHTTFSHTANAQAVPE